jgi:16S rRNA (uracil1498-N3)-methyltransferase
LTPPLFLIPDLTGDVLELIGPEAHHAAVVKRLTPGEIVLLADGAGTIARTEVVTAARDRVRFAVLERWVQPERSPRLVLVQALPKSDRGELAVELMTELGADEIVPWAASRSVSVWRDDRAAKGAAKWRRAAWEASKQSRRARVPVVTELASTAQVASRLRDSFAVILHEDASRPLSALAPDSAPEVIVVIGPEGGIADDELAAFADAGAQTCRLGPEVMRTSTAGAAALAVLSVATGRWA